MKNNKLISRSKNKITIESIENNISITENITDKKVNLSVREFKCECGISVRLEGDVAKDNRITKCSVCRSK